MSPHFPSLLIACLMLLATTLAPGCQASKQAVTASDVDVRSELTITRGDPGVPVSWDDFIQHASSMDIIILGEEHDDAVGHAVQLAVVEDVMGRRNGGTLALEMLERDEQILIDDHVDGIIDTETFAKATSSTAWAGEGSWVAWYQPVIDAALENDGQIIAANAPRRYVRLARRENWEALESLPPDRSGLVAVPPGTIDGVYKERFFEIMQPSDDDQSEDVEVDLSYIEPFYRAQQIWDATMADSVANAAQTDAVPVILLVGRFHSDYNGGTVQEIRRLVPDKSILVVSLETERDEKLEAGKDIQQADIIVFTRSDNP